MDILSLTGIAANGDFQRRVRYLMTKAALAQLAAQDPDPADVLLGQRILQGTEGVSQWALAAMTNSTIAAGLHASDGSTITDSDLEFTVNSLWAAFAK